MMAKGTSGKHERGRCLFSPCPVGLPRCLRGKEGGYRFLVPGSRVYLSLGAAGRTPVSAATSPSATGPSATGASNAHCRRRVSLASIVPICACACVPPCVCTRVCVCMRAGACAHLRVHLSACGQEEHSEKEGSPGLTANSYSLFNLRQVPRV